MAALSLALGIGANTAIFTLADQILHRLLPVQDPTQLVQLKAEGDVGPGCRFAGLDARGSIEDLY